MLSSKPYLLRAIHEWILDNACTPHLVVDASIAGVQVPQQYVKNGQIVLNISPGAVVNFSMGNESVFFSARFGGVPMDIHVPLGAVMGIYARENGRGMMFEPEALSEPEGMPPDDPGRKTGPGKPSLRVVK
jgi:stringent starvation protein B